MATRRSSRGNPWHDEKGRFTNGPGATKTVVNSKEYYEERTRERFSEKETQETRTPISSHGEISPGYTYENMGCIWRVTEVYETNNPDLHYKQRYHAVAIKTPEGYEGADEIDAACDGGHLGSGPVIRDGKGGWKPDTRDEWEKKHNVTNEELQRWGMTREQWEANVVSDRKAEEAAAREYMRQESKIKKGDSVIVDITGKGKGVPGKVVGQNEVAYHVRMGKNTLWVRKDLVKK